MPGDTAGNEIAGIDRCLAGQVPLGRKLVKERDALVDGRIEVITEALLGILRRMIFEAMIIFKKGNFRHGFTSLVNGVATLLAGRLARDHRAGLSTVLHDSVRPVK